MKNFKTKQYFYKLLSLLALIAVSVYVNEKDLVEKILFIGFIVCYTTYSIIFLIRQFKDLE
jgi:hypothetical protein